MRLATLASTSPLLAYTGPVSLFCLSLLLVSMLAPTFPGAFLVLGSLGVLILGLARVPVRVCIRLLCLPCCFLLLSLLSLCVSIQLHIGGIALQWVHSQEPMAVRTGLRSLASLCATLSLALCVPMPRLFAYLRVLRVPLYVVDFLGLMWRMIFLFEESRKQISLAQRNRLGYAGFTNSLRSLALLSAELYATSQRRAMAMERGMASRGGEGFGVLASPKSAVQGWVWVLALGWPLGVGIVAFLEGMS